MNMLILHQVLLGKCQLGRLWVIRLQLHNNNQLDTQRNHQLTNPFDPYDKCLQGKVICYSPQCLPGSSAHSGILTFGKLQLDSSNPQSMLNTQQLILIISQDCIFRLYKVFIENVLFLRRSNSQARTKAFYLHLCVCLCLQGMHNRQDMVYSH
jgi:hypothetical protein